MSKKWTVGLLVGVFLITAFAFAENGGQQLTASVNAALPETPAKPAAAAKPAPAPAKKPLGITYGIDGRVRLDNGNNNDYTNKLNDESRFTRIRTRLFMNVPLGENVSGFVRVGNEAWKRWYTAPANYTGRSFSTPWAAQDIWIDSAYIDIKQLPGLKNTSLRVGRQDIIRGDGQLAMWTGEGALGPRTTATDAFVLGYTRGKQKFELMGIWNPMQDDFYPVINQKYPANPGVSPSANTTYNEMGTQQAVGLYYTNRALKNTDIDVYYFFAKEFDQLKLRAANTYQFTPDRHFNMIGTRLVQRLPYDIVAHGTFVGEFGTQDAMSSLNDPRFGTQSFRETDMRAWGFFGFATKYFPKVKTKPYARFVTEMLSGQDPKSATSGNFDPLFGRYTGHPNPLSENGYANPMFSDLYVSNTTAEMGSSPALYTNLKLIGAEAGFTPLQGKVRRLQIIAAYQHANAMQPFVANPVHYTAPGVLAAGTTAIPPYFSTGLGRYQMLKSDIRFVAFKQLSGYFTIEKLYYGDFYKKSWANAAAPGGIATRDNGIFFRTELNYRFDGFLPFKKAPKA